jgi:hypothetical protein
LLYANEVSESVTPAPMRASLGEQAQAERANSAVLTAARRCNTERFVLDNVPSKGDRDALDSEIDRTRLREWR